ncbi:MAG: hypothetical protein HETSPECPRED_008396 [Heterodermia speciosa]|uniref:Rhodopsin domain-containing protein n=1 Tax=Heterodermia speciosa TaxID=116794 RepID=A0A8H3FXL3_9LECA|nr:MAG: hypothetical protein HETSPECPRED_008396 [Heterodermia speciosa]
MALSLPRAIIATNTILLTLAICSVILRYVVRKQSLVPLGPDDYLVAVALLFSVLLVVTNITGVFVGGFGTLVSIWAAEDFAKFLKCWLIIQFCYILSVAFVKLSVLCFYRRIFSAGRTPLVLKVMLCLTSAWLVSFLIATFAQERPLRCNWTICLPSTTNFPVMYLVCSLTDMLLDIAILCIPPVFIRKLNMSRARKIALVCIFSLGIFCTVASTARLVYAIGYVIGKYTTLEADLGSAKVHVFMWSGIEACASVICANLPCYAPLLKSRPPGSIKTRFRERFSLRVRLDSRTAISLEESGAATRDIQEPIPTQNLAG